MQSTAHVPAPAAFRLGRVARVLAGVCLAASLTASVAAGPVAFGSDHRDSVAAANEAGGAMDLGSLRGQRLAQPVVGMAATASGSGYWLVARDGGIFSFGDARFFGSTGATRLNQPIVGMSATPSGNGYWFVAADGGVFSFGDARFFGSTGAMPLQRPIVGMASTPSGAGYWLVASDGGIFSFGDASFAGSAGDITLGAPVVGMAATSSGNGYWLLVSDGRVLPFGDARALAPVAAGPTAPAVGIVELPDGSGYWAAARTGSVQAFGAARQLPAAAVTSPVVGIAPAANGSGYWLVTSTGDVVVPTVNGATATANDTPAGAFAFLSKNASGQPMRYDPCRPVRYAINPAGAPAGAADEVREAFQHVGTATGITFTDAGDTTETHIRIGSGKRELYQPDRYGLGQWAPILVSWASESEEPLLAGSVLGYGGSTSYWLSSTDPAYVTGEVVFDRALTAIRPGFGAGLTRGNVVQHEIGHVVGLDHVPDRGQVMYPSISDRSPDGYSSGDRAGLAKLGAGAGCLTVADPR